ncbi:34541_t:CDS:2 [Gigaspora margarita]|uniref:34541_t:CDS:1 n=1 Tax=Gigaspora margarita TaxID=4874 RepID=A0ABN7UEX4_GIGMA|nr:34541_t:CDS:2 [Gigaspora margarita]
MWSIGSVESGSRISPWGNTWLVPFRILDRNVEEALGDISWTSWGLATFESSVPFFFFFSGEKRIRASGDKLYSELGF